MSVNLDRVVICVDRLMLDSAILVTDLSSCCDDEVVSKVVRKSTRCADMFVSKVVRK